jgi:cation transport ATPase
MFDPSSAFEEKMTQSEPHSKKNWKEWFLNLLQNISGTVIGFGLLVFLSTLPLLFNFADVKWYAKILMLLGSLYALSFLLILPAIFTEATKSNKWLLFFSPLFAFFIVGIISYFNFELWGHKSLALGVLFTWTMFVGLFLSIKALFNRTLGSENTPIVLIAMAILTLFIAVVNEKTSNNLSADLYYKISVGIVYLIAIALYANRYIYKQKNEHKVISNIIGIIFWGAIITISFPFYIQWCGLTGDDFNTFVSVYAAVLGGGITLAGVAWTIKDNSEKKQARTQIINQAIFRC